MPELEAIFADFALKVAQQLRAEYDPMDEAARRWIQEHVADLVKGVNETTRQSLRDTIEQGWMDGQGVDDIAIRIRDVMDFASRYRSFMIARTETTNTANMGSIAAAKQAGIETKTWYAALDERVCPLCNDLHGTTIPIDEPFEFGGMGPSRHPNCRCTLLLGAGEIEKHQRGKHDQKSHGRKRKQRDFYVKDAIELSKDEDIKGGTYIRGVKVFYSGRQIREVDGLVSNYALPNGQLTLPNDWKKMRGNAIILNRATGETYTSEVHWYECPNIGKVKFKTIPRPEVKQENGNKRNGKV